MVYGHALPRKLDLKAVVRTYRCATHNCIYLVSSVLGQSMQLGMFWSEFDLSSSNNRTKHYLNKTMVTE